MIRRFFLVALVFSLGCTKETEPVENLTGTFKMVSRNGAPLPQRTVATATDSTFLLGGELVVLSDREYHVVDSVRVVSRDATQWYSNIYKTVQIGFGSVVDKTVSLTWQGGGSGDVIVFDSKDHLTVTRPGGGIIIYHR